MNRIVLKKGRDRSVRQRHPWVFSGAVASGSAGPGETVEVVSSDGETLGYGSFSPASQIRVRMLSFSVTAGSAGAPVPDAAYIADLVARAVARRADFFASDATTTACRLINAESDGLPGVVADYYNGHVVCQFTSAGAEYWKPTVVAALGAGEVSGQLPRVCSVSARNDVDVRRKEGLAYGEEPELLAGEAPPALIEITEGPIRYFVDPRKGHKTGFYLDQRDARTAVGAYARGRTVLNCFSYTGGFGLAAAAGGATHVTQVDVSHEALELARRNAERILSTGASARIDHVEADVFKFLRQCRDARRTFDLIVLDPPKFAESKAQVMKAARGYKDINLLAMKLLNPGGILATFSCSGAMEPELFDRILAEAAQDAHRDFQMIARTRQGADHPVALSFPEGLYLKGVILRSF
ncbi:MAG: class I SAM-dependent rRNA methyltransferase [Kiritimatiellia bacterium]